MFGLDFHPTARTITLVDRAIQAAASDTYGICHRRFFPEDGVKVFDWPNYQYAYPWRIWFEQYDLVSATQVTSGGNTIPLNEIFFEPADKEANEPYTYMELNRSTTASFGQGSTPQHDVAITGTWGYTAETAGAGTLAAAVTDTTGTTVTVSDGSLVGVGNVVVVDAERMLVADRAFASTGVTLAGPGLETASAADTQLTVGSSNVFGVGEVIRIDQEQMFITDQLDATDYVVKRAWNGTTLATHSASTTIYASRLLTVTRGALGTTAATHTNGVAVARYVPPGLIHELNVALAENNVLQATSGYARTVGTGDYVRNASGSGLADITLRAVARYGRKARSAVV